MKHNLFNHNCIYNKSLDISMSNFINYVLQNALLPKGKRSFKNLKYKYVHTL